MAQGTVRWFKGYGFIAVDDGENVFVHFKGSGFKSFQDGDRVSFEIEEGPTGASAVKVKKL